MTEIISSSRSLRFPNRVIPYVSVATSVRKAKGMYCLASSITLGRVTQPTVIVVSNLPLLHGLFLFHASCFDVTSTRWSRYQKWNCNASHNPSSAYSISIITGANGFVGRHVVYSLLQRHYNNDSKLQHREMLKQCAIERGENVDDWDRIVLEGKKIRQQAAPTTPQSSSSSSLMEESWIMSLYESGMGRGG